MIGAGSRRGAEACCGPGPFPSSRRPPMKLKPLSPGFGLEASGIDLAQPLSNADGYG